MSFGMILPFEGKKFSSTSVNAGQKPELIQKIKALGGEFHNDLLADTNVLIVGSIDTPKYRFCAQRRHDIIFIKPDAINFLFDSWIKTRDLRSIKLEDHVLSPFNGMSMCLSRLSSSGSSSDSREAISALILELGGNPTDSLTPSNTILISMERAGKRFEKALEWGIPVVHPKWVTDSARRGAALEWRYYDLNLLDQEKIGEGSCLVWDELEPPAEDDGRREMFINSFDTFSHTDLPGRAGEKKNKGLFANMDICPVGFNEKETLKLRSTVCEHGGNFKQKKEELNNIVKTNRGVIVVSSNESFLKFPDDIMQIATTMNLAVVNEWFIERSLHYNNVLFDLWSIPHRHSNLKLNLKVTISGFSGIELLHVTKSVKLLGCDIAETFDETCDFLIINLPRVGLKKSNSPDLFCDEFRSLVTDISHLDVPSPTTCSKVTAARFWGIPVVSAAYLWKILEEGQLPAITDPRWCVFSPSKMEHVTQKNYEHQSSGKSLPMALITNNDLETTKRIERSPAFHHQKDHTYLKSTSSMEEDLSFPTKKPKLAKLAGTASTSNLDVLFDGQKSGIIHHNVTELSNRDLEISFQDPRSFRKTRRRN